MSGIADTPRLAARERVVVTAAVVTVVALVASFTAAVVHGRELAAALPADVVLAERAQWPVWPEPEPWSSQTPPLAPLPIPAETDAPEPEPEPSAQAEAAVEPAAPPPPAPASAPAPPPPAPAPAPGPPAEPQPQPQPQPQVQAASQSESERIFGQQFPAHAAAHEVPGDPATTHWAVIVGVNRYQGRTADLVGSVPDALLLRQLLLQRGWRDDHILLLLDGHATHDNIVRGLEWLARKTSERSTVVFSFSGHMRYQKGDPARDGQYRDSGLWPTDNRYIWDSHFVRMINAVRAERMWVSFQGCHAGGMNDPGMQRPGRIVTYSSLESQKSYEDPEVGHSVQGWFLFAEGIRDLRGDRSGDGRVSVQDAWRWAAPRAEQRTMGRQSPQISDGVGAPFYLEVPAA